MEKQTEQIVNHQKNKQLTASELGDLFTNYLGDTLSICMFDHFLEVVEDDEIRAFVSLAKQKSISHVQAIKQFYEKEEIPIPKGFDEEDINRGAPRLFSDIFMATYIVEMAKAGLSLYGSSLSIATRLDIVEYFKKCLNDTVEIYEKGVELLHAKGIDFEPPTIVYPKQVDFVEKKSFISLIRGKNRPLLATEIKHLQLNLNTNVLGKALSVAFAQVTTSKELVSYFREGATLAGDQIKQIGKILTDDSIPTVKILDVHVTESTSPPFSDKLMLYHVGLATSSAIENIGKALAQTMRHDVSTQYVATTAAIGKYANDGLNLMIENSWLEEPPTSADREKLSNLNK